jgi:23S rRNA pseudouridine2605 synthase
MCDLWKNSRTRGETHTDGPHKMRAIKFAMKTRQLGLARALSKLGYCSRSQAAVLIRAGRVRHNGVTRLNPETPVRLPGDRIEVDRQPIRQESKIYLMLNKPRGLVTTSADENNRETIYSCLPDGLPWIGAVGRLDKASEGLLLLTNDSEWASRISDPQTHMDKTYHVQVSTLVSNELTITLVRGVRTASGEKLRAKRAHILRAGDRNTWLEIVLDEGKNRQIRRMFEQLGIGVLRLVRVAIGPLSLGILPKGKYRKLLPAEKIALDQAIKGSGE